MIRVGRRTTVAAVAACLVVAAGAVTFGSSADVTRYRTAAATVGDVRRTVTHDGTIAASHRSDLAFATDGTVRKVAVGVGDEVEAGDVLVRLDTTDLRAEVVRAEADLADAEAYLEDVSDGQIDTVTRSLGGGATSGASTTATGAVVPAVVSAATATTMRFASSTSTDLEAAVAALTAQQAAVTTAQSEATAALATAKEALATQRSACEDPDADDGSGAGLTQACTEALGSVEEAQDVVAQRQQSLQSALERLGATLTAAVERLAEADPEPSTEPSTEPSAEPSAGPRADDDAEETPPAGSATGADRDAARSAPDGAAGGDTSAPSTGGQSGTTATAADLASAQADVDTAEATLASARADLEAATITAPFDGTVAAVDVVGGDTVAAADRGIVLIGDGATTATLSVPVDDLGELAVDQQAIVTTAAGATATGRVSAIGLAPETSDGQSSATTYTVTVLLDGDVSAPEGSAASVALVTGTAADVVTVPTSAITRRTATSGTVLVLGADGEVSRTQVGLGPVSGTVAAVTEGLDEGARVVLADLGADLPSSGTADTRSITGAGRGMGPQAGGTPGGRRAS